MPLTNTLFLHEEIMLLALKDKKGTVVSGTNYRIALGGAILAELLLSQRIQVEKKRKNKYAIVSNIDPLGESILDECLEKIKTSKRRQQLQTWVSRFSGLKNLKPPEVL